MSTPPTAGITARLFCFQDPSHRTCFSRLFPISHLSLSVRPLQVRLFTLILSRTSYLSCLRMRPTCRQLPAGAARQGRFYFHFSSARLRLLGRSRTAGLRPTAREGPVVWTRSFFQFPPALWCSVCREHYDCSSLPPVCVL